MALIPFKDGKPVERISFWSECEVIKGSDGYIRVIGPHGAREFGPGVTLEEHEPEGDWPQPCVPQKWEKAPDSKKKKEWRTQGKELIKTSKKRDKTK